MQNYQFNIEDLGKSTVAIQKTGENGRILGTGVIVTDDGLILTCYHVIRNKQNEKLGNEKNFNIYFSDTKEIKPVEIIEEYCNPSLDIAFLQLQEKKLPNQAKVSQLSESIYFGNPFASIGFRKPDKFDSLTSKGEIRRITDAKQQRQKTDEATTKPKSMLQIYSDEIEPGMSGAPVLDLDTNKVIGIVSEHWVSTGNVDTKLNFAIPIQSVIEVNPDIRNKNSGLLKINEFLEIIELGSESYKVINDVYVPPVEYDEIKEALERDRIVFIVGTREYGKTYTAIKLLWEYYKKGYKPKYLQTEEEEKKAIRKELAGLIQRELTSKSIIYFEDPFGKVKYQYDEDLENEIGTIIDCVRNSADTYTIITSREEVFKEFEYKSIAEKLLKFEKNLNIKTPSYDYEKRKEMLLKWAKAKGCKWVRYEPLTNLVLNSLKDETKLSSPLKIRDYAISTVSTTCEKELVDLIDEKSRETAKSFAKEINEMEQDKILFLMFPFISDGFSEKFVKSNYEVLVTELKIEAWEFSAILDHFKRDKIDIKNENIRFSHPSYSESIKYIIFDKRRKITKAGEILEKVLLKLANYNYYDYNVAMVRIIADNFNLMPDEVQKLFFKLANKGILSWVVCGSILSNVDKIGDNNVRSLLLNLVDSGFFDLAEGLASNFDKLSENIRNELLVKLADKAYYDDILTRYVAKIISSNFDKLSENIRNELLVKLADNNYNYFAARYAAHIVSSNFDKLPENVRNELLLKVADSKEAASRVHDAVFKNFDKIPESIRNEILRKLGNSRENSDGTST